MIKIKPCFFYYNATINWSLILYFFHRHCMIDTVLLVQPVICMDHSESAFLTQCFHVFRKNGCQAHFDLTGEKYLHSILSHVLFSYKAGTKDLKVRNHVKKHLKYLWKYHNELIFHNFFSYM